MNLSRVEKEERNAHMQNTMRGSVVALQTPARVMAVIYLGHIDDGVMAQTAYVFMGQGRTTYCTDSNSPYWDFTVSEGN